MFNSDKYLSVKWLKGGRVYPGSTVSALSMKSRGDLLSPVMAGFFRRDER
jgi:hypothetical protein